MTVAAALTPSAAAGARAQSAPFLHRPGVLERSVLLLTLFVYAWGTPLEWLANASGAEITSSLLTQALFLGFLGNTVVALNGNWHVVLSAMKAEPLLAVYVAFLTISTLWSTVPATSLQDGIVLSVTYLTAMHLIVRFSLVEIVAMLATVFAIGIVLNLAFVIAFEGQALNAVAISTTGGVETGWSGITVQKNSLGRASVLGYLVCLVNARVRRSWFMWPSFAALNALAVVGSNSATSLGALIGVSVLGLVFLGFRGRKTLYGATMLAMGLVFSTLTVLAATNLAAFTGLIGRDSNFTGRLPIWRDSFTFGVADRPLLGYGFGGFWRHGEADFEVQIRTNNFDTPHAHNALIDAWLQLGPLGALILAAIFVRGLVWATRHIRALPTAIGMFPALTISLALIYSTTESGFVSRSIQFIMFVVAITVAATHKGVQRPFEERIRRGDRRIDSSVPTFASR